MIPSDSQIAELKAQHGSAQLHLLTFDDGASAVVAKQPPRAEWSRFITVSSEPANRGRAVEDFARACIVWPGPAELDAMVSERPALLAKFGGELADLAGASEKIVAKKL